MRIKAPSCAAEEEENCFPNMLMRFYETRYTTAVLELFGKNENVIKLEIQINTKSIRKEKPFKER